MLTLNTSDEKHTEDSSTRSASGHKYPDPKEVVAPLVEKFKENMEKILAENERNNKNKK